MCHQLAIDLVTLKRRATSAVRPTLKRQQLKSVSPLTHRCINEEDIRESNNFLWCPMSHPLLSLSIQSNASLEPSPRQEPVSPVNGFGHRMAVPRERIEALLSRDSWFTGLCPSGIPHRGRSLEEIVSSAQILVGRGFGELSRSGDMPIPAPGGRLKHFGHLVLTHYEMSCGEFFSWEHLDEVGVLTAVMDVPAVSHLGQSLKKEGLTPAQLLGAIHHWLVVYRVAQSWGERLSKAYVSSCGGEIDEDALDSVNVDAAISEFADEDPALFEIVDTNPDLHSAICLETSRFLDEIFYLNDAP